MIFVGTDIVPISRIDKMIQEHGEHFLNYVFSCNEQDICNKKSQSKFTIRFTQPTNNSASWSIWGWQIYHH